MIDTLLDIPYKIIEENIEYDEIFKTITITRTYKLPKSIFKSPNIFANEIRKYDRKVVIKDNLKMFIYSGGWADPECKYYGMMIIIANAKHYGGDA